jgi:CRISPR-associated protein Csc3
MPRRQRTSVPEEPELFTLEDEESLPEELDVEVEDEGEAQQTTSITLADEPLGAALLRQAIRKLWPDDTVMTDFVTHVAGPLSALLGTHGAKGGYFVVQRMQAGLSVDGDYTHDQSFRAHLLNGLFPVLHIAHLLKGWDAPRLRYLHDQARRLFMAGYVLHDWLKLPDVDTELRAAGLSHDTVNAQQHLAIIERLFCDWCERLGLAAFLQPLGGYTVVLHDLIYIACNTQVKWGTLRNVSAVPRLSLDGRTLDVCESLSRLADLVTYVARTPSQVTTHTGIHREIAELSNNTAYLCYHHVADNRGVLTNLIHNAALGAMSHSLRQPILYAPSGVVYLAHHDAPPLPEIRAIIDATVERVQQVSAQRLRVALTGFRRDGKGLKSADYYDLFFDLKAQIQLAARAAFKMIPPTKKPSAGKRYTKMRDGDWLDPSINLDLPDDIRVDQLAEWCYYVETLLSKQDVSFDIADFLFDTLQLTDVRPIFDAIPRDNRAGGVGYHWYFAAGYYLKCHPGYDPTAWQTLIEQLAERLANTLVAEPTMAPSPQDAWAELRAYTQQIFSSGPVSTAGVADRAAFIAELVHYHNAKRTGRGRTAVCSLCSSSFEVAKQQEAAILFSPMVYSNKMPLHGAMAIRDICPICSLEIMLRQLLMNRSEATGGRFEGRQIRYLSFYPTYFFSPETLEVFRLMHNRLQRLSFTELRRQLLGPTAHNGNPSLHLDADTLQRLEPLLLAADELGGANTDRYVRMHFPEHEPITFYFLGIPPASRDAKDAESWVHPAFLALLIPVCLDVKVVASASPLPLFREADEFPETVFLDGAHSFVQSMVGKERINIDEVLPSLQRLIVEYLIHMDAHSRQSRGSWDYRWSKLPPLARDLAVDTAYACYYLKKWQRNAGIDTIPFGKAQQYMSYLPYLAGGERSMSHARTFVHLYRQFYRARRQNSNNILRPLSVAANTILSANRRLFDREGLVEVVRGELRAFLERVQTGGADGMLPPGSTRASREEAMGQFATFFVNTVFYDALRGDVASLRGRQLNLLKSACEMLYREATTRDWHERHAMEDTAEEEDNS